MFQTLFGNRTSLQQLQTNNFLCSFHSKLTSSNPSISQTSPSSMQRLGNMLTIRNKKYKNKQISNVNDFNVISLNLKEKQDSKLKLDNSSIFCEDGHYVGFQDAEAIIEDFAQKFLMFGLGGKIEVWMEGERGEKELVVIRILGQALRNMNLGYSNGTYTLEQSKSETLLKQLQQKQPQINELQLLDPLWTQLTQQLNHLKQNPINPILSIFINNNNRNSQSTNSKFLPGLSQQNKQKKFKLFLSEQPGKRVLLNRYLYELNDQSMFHIVSQYDSFFINTERGWCVEDIRLFSRKLGILVEGANGNQAVGWLMGLVGGQWVGGGGFRGWEDVRSWAYGVDFFLKIMQVKVWRWATVKMSNTEQAVIYHDLIKQKYIRQFPKILETVPDTPQNKALQIKLLNYNSLDSLNKNKHLLALFLLQLQQPTTTKLLSLTLSSQYTKQTQIYEKLKQIVHQHPIPTSSNKQKQNKFYNNHSMSNSHINKNAKTIIDFVTDCLPLLSLDQRVELLLSNRVILENIDWQYLLSLITQSQQVQIVSLVIPASIRIYKNTTAFLNTGIPFQSIMPYYEIQILIQGLTSILTQDARLTEKDKSKFFGMMSIYRGETLPVKQQFPMTVLQMLFEWYMLKQAIIEEDYKSLGLSLRCNLEQVSSVYTPSTDGLTQSSRSHVTQRMHNPDYLNKIGNPQFMKILNQQTQYHNLYISYLYVICESICEIKQSRQKIIRSNKIQIWVDLLLMKIRSSLEDAKGELSRKLAKLRDACLKVFAVHGF